MLLRLSMNKKGVTMRFFLVIAVLSVLEIMGCGSEEIKYTYLEARKVNVQPPLTITMTLVRPFEKMKWCQSQKESFFEEGGFESKCLEWEEGKKYEPMFRGDAVGKWYAIRRVGRFNPSVVFFEFEPPLPDVLMAAQLKQMAPHILQFAALHRAPAEVQIISPDGEII